jgi:hypothetical protein
MNPRLILYSIIAGIVLILVFFFIGKSYGKSIPPGKVPLPDDNGNSTGQASDSKIMRITDDLKEDIYSWFTRDSAPYVELMGLSDTDFVRVYNDWNARYYSKDNQTLKQAIEGEFLSSTSFTFYNLKPQLMERFSRLGLQ